MLITHAVSITMPQIAFDLQMAGMTCTRRNIGRVSCADFALDRQSAIILPIDQASVDLVYGPPPLQLRSMIWSNESKAAAHCQCTRDGQ